MSVFSIVIHVKNGVIDGILWDNECAGCPSCFDYEIPEEDRIEGGPGHEHYCSQTQEECDLEKNCDPEIFVSWLGTDSNQNVMYSASQRLSNFNKFSVDSMYNSIKKQ